MTEKKFFELLAELPSKGWKACIFYNGEALLLAAPGSEEYIHSPLAAVAIEQGFQPRMGFQSLNSEEVSNVLDLSREIAYAIDSVVRDVFPERPHLYSDERLKRHEELREKMLKALELSNPWQECTQNILYK